MTPEAKLFHSYLMVAVFTHTGQVLHMFPTGCRVSVKKIARRRVIDQ